MTRKKALIARLAAALLFALAIPSVVFAQSGIAGVVKDTSAAVLPGVTVEAASPALIEKVRSVVSDAQGQYKILDLRPGTYTVTFSLPGFSTVKREGIQLATNFTANVNGEMRVGAIEETVTVSGAAPVVDVQNVIQQQVINKDVITALPTARSQQNVAALIPGMTIGAVSRANTQDVGGSAGDMRQTVAIHGGRQRDMNETIEGIPQNGPNGVYTGGINMDSGAVQEFAYELGAISASHPNGGVIVNTIPKEGGNHFSGSFFTTYSGHQFQSDNTDANLIARGVGVVNHLEKIWDTNPSFGGPIKQEKAWFYLSTRYWGSDDRVAGMWYNLTPKATVYTPDLSRQALDDQWLGSASFRTTWQVNGKNKINALVLDQSRCLCHQGVSSTLAPEAGKRGRSPVDYLMQGTWSAPLTNRLLLEAGAQRYRFEQPYDPQVGVNDYSIQELSTGMVFRAGTAYARHDDWMHNYRGSVSYVTGSQAIKVGFDFQDSQRRNASYESGPNANLDLRVLNGVPTSIVENSTPYYDRWVYMNSKIGLYAQDQWTINHVTLNLGVRYDHHNESVPAQHLPAVQLVGVRDFPAIPDVPNWNDISPRVGVAWDLFGTGKTAVKGTLSRYVGAEMVEFGNANNPIQTSVNSAMRTWNDLNHNFVPDCDLTNIAVNGECGRLSNENFGKLNITTTYADTVRTGWGVRPYNWEASVSVSHELLPNVSLNVAYFRRWFGNFSVTQNAATPVASYDPFCVTAPADSRLPGGGGYQICGLYDVNPSKFSQVNNLVTTASAVGSEWEHYNGIDFTTNARLRHGVLLLGGLSAGRTELNLCDVVLNRPDLTFQGRDPITVAAVSSIVEPRTQAYCDTTTPFQPQVKLLGTFPLPWNLQTSATFQSLPGPQITAARQFTSAQIAPSLGRNLSSGANGILSIDMIAPGTMYGDRLYQTDLRMSKIVKIQTLRIQGNFDVYNAFNANPVLLQNNIYGPAWLAPTGVLAGRLLKLSAQIDF